MVRGIPPVRLTLAILVGLAIAGHPVLRAQPRDQAIDAKVDAVFARWDSTTTPGCAVAVAVGDRTALEKAYGMADLEHGVPNRANTIFEAGSVSKQFTAAAVLLLAQDGKLSLDDPARKYVPELPDYGAPLTIRHMLQHTSGLRDWGTITGLAGWPRTARVHTHAHVLDIASRQRSLNFQPGTDWSYSNTGYNLAAIIVSRVAGESFAEFTRKRIFAPLGMTRTSWRDDHTRIVQDRAIAYAQGPGGFRINMPFENVHGNGGLLTTVGDLLRWNENFVAPTVGGADLVAQQQQRGRFADGREHDYGLGLFIGEYKGVRQVRHSGSTAGYQAHLVRFPEPRVSISVLCNVSGANATRYAYEVADLYLAGSLKPAPAESPVKISAETAGARAGLYRSTKTGEAMALVSDKDTLRVQGGTPLTALSGSRFQMGANDTVIEFDDEGSRPSARARVLRPNGTREEYERVEAVRPTPEQLAEYAGLYTSDEVEVALTAVVEGGELTVRRRPDTSVTLRPLYADAFASSLGTIRFHRDEGGRVVALGVVTDRAWDVRFARGDAGRPSRH